MAKKSKPITENSCLTTNSQSWSFKFKVGDSVQKLAKGSDNYGLVGVIRSKEVAPGGYHFCWVMWQENRLRPEHYNCIKKWRINHD